MDTRRLVGARRPHGGRLGAAGAVLLVGLVMLVAGVFGMLVLWDAVAAF